MDGFLTRKELLRLFCNSDVYTECETSRFEISRKLRNAAEKPYLITLDKRHASPRSRF